MATSVFNWFIFLVQAVLFDAAVPFFLPVWALARARFRKYLIWVFIGGMAGGAFLGVGQAVIHLFQLGLFTVVIRYKFARKSIQLTVAVCILFVQVRLAVNYVCGSITGGNSVVDWL